MKRWFCLLFLAGNVLAAGTDALVEGWLRQQTNVQTWAADFTQTRTLRALAFPLVSTGQVWFAAPGNFRWELERDQTIAIRNGDVMQVLYPQLHRAERYATGSDSTGRWKDTLALLESGFPRSRQEFDHQFKVLDTVSTNNLVRLDLEPRSAGARKMMPRVNLYLHADDLKLAGTELVFVDGSRMRNEFHNVRTNLSMEGRFDLTVPPGVKLAEPLIQTR